MYGFFFRISYGIFGGLRRETEEIGGAIRQIFHQIQFIAVSDFKERTVPERFIQRKSICNLVERGGSLGIHRIEESHQTVFFGIAGYIMGQDDGIDGGIQRKEECIAFSRD